MLQQDISTNSVSEINIKSVRKSIYCVAKIISYNGCQYDITLLTLFSIRLHTGNTVLYTPASLLPDRTDDCTAK